MAGIGLWRINDNTPTRLTAGAVGLERDLEAWIERDPALLESGLVVVARQLHLEGGPLDLLALDPQGRWVLIEIKRDRLRRDVIAQAIDYASCLRAIDADSLRTHCDNYLSNHSGDRLDDLLQDRGRTIADDEDLELVIYLVGTGVDPGLERMVAFLSESANLAVRIVTFSVFDDPSQSVMLAREIHEGHAPEREPERRGPRGAAPSVEESLSTAARNGIGEMVQPIFEAATSAGLYARPTNKGMMFTPQENKSRTLIYAPIDRQTRMRDGEIRLWIAEDAFEQFYGIDPNALQAAFGSFGHVYVDAEGARAVARGIHSLLGHTGDGEK